MHRLLHGIRWDSCWTVASPPISARLPHFSLPPVLNQPFGYGDLLPQSGVEEDGDEEGDLPPSSGDENGEGLLPSQGPDSTVLCDLQPQYEFILANHLDIPSSKSIHGNPDFAAALNVENAKFAAVLSVKNVEMGSLSEFQTLVFDPRGPLGGIVEYVTFLAYECSWLLWSKVARPTDGYDWAYTSYVWFNVSKCKDDVAIYFLIPLRGSNGDQWNDEVINEVKTKMQRRMMVIPLFYLTKDLLDPG